MVEESKAKDFETYLISALNDSLLKKSISPSLKPLSRRYNQPPLRVLVD